MVNTNQNDQKTHIVIYDGSCGICNASRLWIERRDKGQNMAFIAYQSPEFSKISQKTGIGIVQASHALYFIESTGRYYQGSRAGFEILNYLPSAVWKVIGRFGSNNFIGSITQPFYQLIAKNRRKISIMLGKTACPFPNQ